MRDPMVRDHRFRDIVLTALKSTQSMEEGSPQAMGRATKAIVDADSDIRLPEAFRIVWDIWDV